jgi:hypothetical protein
MTSPDEISGQHEAARQQSRDTWNAVAPGWYAHREELWKASRPISEWMVRKLDPQPGDTVLELAAGLGDTGLMAARSQWLLLAGCGKRKSFNGPRQSWATFSS